MTLLTAQRTRQKCVVMFRCLEYGFVENGWFCLRGKEELCKKKTRFFRLSCEPAAANSDQAELFC
jgi:hypothetical protein